MHIFNNKMDNYKYLLIGFLILGFFNQALSKDYTDDYLDEDYDNYKDYEEEEKPDTNAISPNDVTPIDPPRFDSPSETIRARPGDKVVLPCPVKNLQPTNVILWYNTTQAVTQMKNVLTQQRIKVTDDYGLEIRKVIAEDSNVYSCTIYPQNINYNVTLIVTKDDSVDIKVNDLEGTKKQFTFRQGDAVTLECNYHGEEKNTKIKWSLNGGTIHQHSAHVEGNKIIIHHIDAKNAGTYQCLGDIPQKNSNLPVTYVDIIVRYKPKTSTHRHHVNTKENHHAELTCDYHANPIAQIEWRKGADLIARDSEKYEIKYMKHGHRNRSVLVIKDIDVKNDIGTYICEAKNGLGSDYTKFYVKLEPETPLYEKHSVEGRIVNFYWLARSTTPLVEAILDYKMNKTADWMTEAALNTKKHEDEKSIWKIHHKLEVPEGDWEARVRVKNKYGWSEFSKPYNFIVKDMVVTEDAPVDNVSITTEILPPVDIVKPTDAQDEIVLKSGFGVSGSGKDSNLAASSSVMYLIILVTSFLSIINLVP